MMYILSVISLRAIRVNYTGLFWQVMEDLLCPYVVYLFIFRIWICCSFIMLISQTLFFLFFLLNLFISSPTLFPSSAYHYGMEEPHSQSLTSPAPAGPINVTSWPACIVKFCPLLANWISLYILCLSDTQPHVLHYTWNLHDTSSLILYMSTSGLSHLCEEIPLSRSPV